MSNRVKPGSTAGGVSRPQDYRNADNLAMGVMDALNRTVYDPEEHVADGEQTPASQQVERPHRRLRPSGGAGWR